MKEALIFISTWTQSVYFYWPATSICPKSGLLKEVFRFGLFRFKREREREREKGREEESKRDTGKGRGMPCFHSPVVKYSKCQHLGCQIKL